MIEAKRWLLFLAAKGIANNVRPWDVWQRVLVLVSIYTSQIHDWAPRAETIESTAEEQYSKLLNRIFAFSSRLPHQ